MSKALSNKIFYTTFLLSLLVIALHASYLEQLDATLPGYDFAFIVQRLLLVVGESAVPTFFVVSGYLLFRKFELRDYPRMLLKKVFSLVIPYFIWSVLGFLAMQVFLPLMSGQAISMTFPSAVVDILLANDYPLLWFVRPLMAFFVCSPLLYFTFKYLKRWSIFIPVVLFFVYLFFRPYYGGILIWIPMFFLGAYFAYFGIPVLNKFHPRLVSLAAIAALVALAVTFTLIHAQYEDYAYYCYRFAAPLLVWTAMDALTPLFEKEGVPKVFKTSGFIFFSHLGLVNALKLLFQLGIPADSNYNCAALFFLVFLASCLIDVGLAYVLKRFVNPVYRYLGGR